MRQRDGGIFRRDGRCSLSGVSFDLAGGSTRFRVRARLRGGRADARCPTRPDRDSPNQPVERARAVFVKLRGASEQGRVHLRLGRPMKNKGLGFGIRSDFATISDRGSVAGRLRRAAERRLWGWFRPGPGRRREASRFSVGVVAAGASGVLSRRLVGVRLVVGASRGRVEVQTSGARGLPRDFAL